MTYGIDGFTASGGFLIDSNTTSTKYLTVVEIDECDAGSHVDKDDASDLVFAKPFNTSSSTANRVIFNTIADSLEVEFLHKVHYVRLRKAQSTSPSGNNYGVQIKNAANAIIFDSRTATSGMKVLGAKSPSQYALAIQPNNSANVSVSSPNTSFGGTSTIVHAGNPANVYVACLAGAYNIQAGFQLVIGGFYYDYSNNRILGEAYFDLDFSSNTTSGIPAMGAALTGELVT